MFFLRFVLYFQRASLAEREMSTLKEQLLTTSPGPSATSTPSTSPAPLSSTCAKATTEVEQVLTAPPSPSNENNNSLSKIEVTNNPKKYDEEYENNASTSIEDKNSRLKDSSNVTEDQNEEANLIEAKDKEVC